MANSINTTGAITTVSSIDSNYDVESYLPVYSIRVNAGNTSANTFVIKNGGDSGANILKANVDADKQFVQYYGGQLLSPFLDYSSCSLTAGAEVTIAYDRGRS